MTVEYQILSYMVQLSSETEVVQMLTPLYYKVEKDSALRRRTISYVVGINFVN